MRRVWMLTPILVSLLVATAEPAAARDISGPSAKQSCSNVDSKPWTLSLNKSRAAVLCQLDKVRQRHHLARYKLNHDLNHAATHHSEYMVKRGCFEHVCPGELPVLSRLRLTGFFSGILNFGYSENIAWGEGGKGTARNIVKSWMHSPEHRAAILDGDYRYIGIGVARGDPIAPRKNSCTFTTDFAYRHG